MHTVEDMRTTLDTNTEDNSVDTVEDMNTEDNSGDTNTNASHDRCMWVDMTVNDDDGVAVVANGLT